MPDFFDTPISAYKNVTDTTPATVTLRQFLFSKKCRTQILALREEKEKKRRDELKKQLPAATISGTFTKRAAAHIETYNGIVCLDFDAAENPGKSPADMKRILAGFLEVAYAAVSVGGAGTFALIPTTNTDPTQHAAVVELLGKVMSAFGLTYDRSCKDVSRLRIISHDPDAWVKPTAAPFDVATVLTPTQRTPDESRPPRPLIIRPARRDSPTNGGGGRGGVDRTTERVEALIGAVEQSRKDVVDDYDDWIRIGFALASHFGMEGKDYFLRISQFHHPTKRDPEKKYDELYKNGKKVRIGTFFKILDSHGFSL